MQNAIVEVCKGERLCRAGMLLLRFEGDIFSDAARERYGRICYYLDKMFEYHCGALEFDKRGGIHLHLIVVAHEDIASGFGRLAYSQYVAIKDGKSSGLIQPEDRSHWLRELPKNFTPNEHLQFIRQWLNKRITKARYGFLPIRIEDFAPLMKAPIAAARYVTKQLLEPSTQFRRFVKGTRMIVLPRKIPKTMTRAFSWHNPKARSFREKCALIASYLGCDRDAVKARFGSDWMKVVGALMAEVENRNPLWPGYRHPYFDADEFCREWVRQHGL